MNSKCNTLYLLILTSPNPSKGGENSTIVDLSTNLKSSLWGDLEGSNDGI